MASIRNDRDILLQAASTRVVQSTSNSIVPVYSANKFSVNNGVATPSTITITYNLLGNLYGTATFSIISGISSINTSVAGQATLSYSNMTADTCVVRISLVFFGVTYYTDCTLEGKISVPANVSAGTALPEYEKLILTWPKNSEADVLGYEVRETNSGWGDTNYAYHGGNTSCIVTPGTLGVLKTWYVKAYDDSNLYSTTATQISYTVSIPTQVTGLSHSFEASSNTNFSVTITWSPSTALFKPKNYIVRVSPPTGGYTEYPTTDTSITLPADWVGSATVNLYVKDYLNNTSLASSNLIVNKSIPNPPSNLVSTPSGDKLLVTWTSAVKTTLPVAGYEIRLTDTNWGTQDSNFVWRGSANSLFLSNIVAGVNTFYIGTFDTNNVYSSSLLFTYTALTPNTVSGLTATYSYTSNTIATVKVTWVPPVVTSFAISKYEITFTRPGYAVENLITSATSLTLQADWINTAVINIRSVDVLGLESSSTADLGIIKSRPAVPGVISYTPNNTNMRLSWDLVAQTTLPVIAYEVRNADTNWGVSNANLIWKGFGQVLEVPFTTSAVGNNYYYLKAVDTDGVYSETSRQVNAIVTVPGTVATPTASFSNTNVTGITVKVTWAEVASQFPLSYYLVSLTKPGPIVTTVKVTSAEYSTLVDWSGTASISVTAVDILGHSGTAGLLNIPKVVPNTPAIPTYTALSKNVLVTWVDTAKTSLPIAGYEIRTTTTGWGTAGYVYRGSSTSAYIGDTVLGLKTYYLKAFDTAGEYSTGYSTLSYTLTGPTVASIDTPIFADTATTAATVTLSWEGSEGSFDIGGYTVTLTKPGPIVTTSKISSNTLTLQANWVGDATLSVTPYDITNNTGTTSNLIINKALPNQPGTVSQRVVGSTIVLSWENVATTTLPISGYELRSTSSGWGSPGALWRGSALSCSLDSLPVGSNTAYLATFDTDGRYSAATLVTYNIINPDAVAAPTYSFADTSNTGATITMVWAAPTISAFGVSEYVVTLTKPGPIVVSTTQKGTTWTTNADWIGNATLSITVKDVLGHTSSATNLVIGKTAPTAPTTFSVATNTAGITISWPNAVKGSLPIAGYELRTTGSTPGTAGYVWKGTASSVPINTLSLGSNTWDLWVYDTDNRYSAAARAISYTVSSPSAVTGLAGIFSTNITTSTATLSWVAPSTSVFGIKHYVVSFAYTTPSVTTLTNTLNSVKWEIPANWTGSGTLSVTAYDNLGFVSATATLGITKSLPSTPGAVTTTPANTSLLLDWPDTITTSLPVIGYEIRTTDSGWGAGGYIWKGNTSQVPLSIYGYSPGTITRYIKAFDTDNKYSSVSRTISYVLAAPIPVSNITHIFTDTSLTAATVTLSWDAVTPVFGLDSYELVYDTVVNALPVTKTELVNTTTITLPANWIGDKTFTIRTKDRLGNYSSGVPKLITKLVPNPIFAARAQVIDNNVLLYWSMPTMTSLPLSHVFIRKVNELDVSTNIGEKTGTFTSISELSGGNYTYYIKAVDTDGRESTEVALPAVVSQPPDFIFNAEYTSAFSGTLSSALLDNGSLIIPVNLTETFAGHFTSRGWVGPEDPTASAGQIDAGYPVYIQPGITSGYYEEVFDYGSSLASSQVVLSIAATIVSGNPTIATSISTSIDNVTYTTFTGVTSIYATDFRYVKIKISVTQDVVGSIYKIDSLVVRLDSKQTSDSGSIDAVSTDASGTIANFTSEFVDINLISLAPALGTASYTALYDFRDYNISGTYSLTSNVCTVTTTAHNLIAGQRVRLYFTTGTAAPGVYTIASVVNANSFTVSIVTANTSGNLTTYPNSIRIYLYNTVGVRQSGKVSWSIKGY